MTSETTTQTEKDRLHDQMEAAEKACKVAREDLLAGIRIGTSYTLLFQSIEDYRQASQAESKATNAWLDACDAARRANR